MNWIASLCSMARNELRLSTASSSFAAQQQRHLSEDHAQCRDALADPRRALREQIDAFAPDSGITIE